MVVLVVVVMAMLMPVAVPMILLMSFVSVAASKKVIILLDEQWESDEVVELGEGLQHVSKPVDIINIMMKNKNRSVPGKYDIVLLSSVFDNHILLVGDVKESNKKAGGAETLQIHFADAQLSLLLCLFVDKFFCFSYIIVTGWDSIERALYQISSCQLLFPDPENLLRDLIKVCRSVLVLVKIRFNF